MAEKKGYAGKISHSGVQKVESPFGGGDKADKGKVSRGDDLRSGGGKKK